MASKILSSVYPAQGKCNKPMGIRSLRDPARKLRFCVRDAATCQYHAGSYAKENR